MRASRLGTALLGLGVLVGAVAGLGLLLGFEPARLPAALLNVAVYKLTFLAAFGLLAAGAVVHRFARRTGTAPRAADAPIAPEAPHALQAATHDPRSAATAQGPTAREPVRRV